MRRTKVDEKLERAEQEHADDPRRAELIRCTRRFKASWIELAEALTQVRRRSDWKHWGHSSFEAYAKNELHLRADTVEKLTGSFAFLQRHAPEVLGRDGITAPIPSYHSVDFLRRAEAEEGAPRDVVDSLRQRVLEDVAPLAAISREFKQAFFPESETERGEREEAALKNVAGRLRELAGESQLLPRRLNAELCESLDKLLAWLQARGERAA